MLWLLITAGAVLAVALSVGLGTLIGKCIVYANDREGTR